MKNTRTDNPVLIETSSTGLRNLVKIYTSKYLTFIRGTSVIVKSSVIWQRNLMEFVSSE